MNNRTGPVTPLPEGFNPCLTCKGTGERSHTRIREKTSACGTQVKQVLSHWCDPGRKLTSIEKFYRSGRGSTSDFTISSADGGSRDDIAAIWNKINQK